MKSVTDFGEISHRFWGNLTPILRKSVTDFEEICPGVWGNPSPILGKSVTDFEEIWEICPTLGKFVTDFGKIWLRFWENQPPTEESRLRVCERQAPFWIGLGQSSSLLCCFFLDWVLPKKSVAGFPKVGDRLPKIGGRFSPSRWQIFQSR